MKRIIAAVSLVLAASPLLAQPTDPIMPAVISDAAVLPVAFVVTPTDAIMPAQPYVGEARTRVASAGRLELETFSGAMAGWADLLKSHVEHRPGYADPGQ